MTDEHTDHELFELSPDAILVMEGDRFVDCNPAAVKMLRFPDKQSVLEAHPADISPRQQPDGQTSLEKAETFLGIASERGSHIFEWTHTCADGDRVLFMSGYSDAGDLSVPGNVESAVLPKPFTPAMLQAEIRRVLDQ